MDKKPKIKIIKSKTKELEKQIMKIDDSIPSLKKFVMPGGCELSARIDIARSVSRRMERRFVAFSNDTKLRAELLQYLNRLSSILFALAQLANHRMNIPRVHPSYE